MHTEHFDYDIIESVKAQENTAPPLFKGEITRTEGLYLYDEEENKYLDLTSNNDNMPRGFSFDQQESGFFETRHLKSKAASGLEELVKEKTGYEKTRVFQEKSLAYGFLKELITTKPEKSVLISSVENGNINFTEKNVINIHLNDESALKTFLNKNTAAVIVEIVQVKGYLELAEIKYLELLKELCVKNNALLIYDTCSISPLRLNRGLFNFDKSIQPDIFIASRGLTAGRPFYMVSFREDICEKADVSESPGTYSAGYKEAVDFIQNNEKYKTTIEENAWYIEKKFKDLEKSHIGLADFIPYGMLYEIVTEIPSEEFTMAAFKKGLVLRPLGQYTVLLCPPYNIDKEVIDRVIEVFDELFNELTKYDRLGE